MQNDRRLELHEKLCEVLGSRNVYFQPPETVKMKYPAIVYHLDNGREIYANNKSYLYRRNYAVTAIDKNPEVEWDEKILDAFEYCDFQRAFVADNLNHWQFSLYW